MESKWYFFPGQTPENTKISDRAHALHITAEAWNGITQHLQRKQKIQEAMDREKAHKEALKKGSEAMTKQWLNSIENLRLRKEEERHDRLTKEKEDKIQMFYKLRAEQEIVRKEYIEKVQKEAFISCGHSKELTSALMTAETLHEREKQREFNQKLRNYEEELNKKVDSEMLANDARQKQQLEEEKSRRFEEERKVAETLRQQIQENEDRRKAEYRELVEEETRDRIKAAEEDRLLKQFETDQKQKKRKEIALERRRAIQDQRKNQQAAAKATAEVEMAAHFYNEAKRRIDCLKKMKEKEMRDEIIHHRQDMAEKTAVIQAERTAEEDERIAKAIAEKEAAEVAKAEEKAAFKAQATKDRIEDRRQYLERLEKEKQADSEIKRWGLLKRCKAAEAIKEYNEQKLREKWAKINEYRKDLIEQMAEEEETKKREKEIDEYLSRVSYEEADRMFFDYANEVLELAKKKGRSTYPIEKVIHEYEKLNSLVPTSRYYRCKK